MIEREVIEFVAAADWTDDCRIRIQLRKPVSKLTISEAKAFRSELDAAIAEAERAADGLRHEHEPAAFDLVGGITGAYTFEGEPLPQGVVTFAAQHVHPECVAGKCGNCDGQVLTIDDEWAPCTHACHKAAAA